MPELQFLKMLIFARPLMNSHKTEQILAFFLFTILVCHLLLVKRNNGFEPN